ncbi:MAG: lipase family protein [Spirochaetaceae bacterium]|nr:MAG: lipase family protein [Spirochaetaceae bacterium]
MYFPKYFNRKLSIKLGKLIVQAYDQFTAFEKEQKWELSGDYKLLGEITYPWNSGKGLYRKYFGFDFSFLDTASKKKNRDFKIPIGFFAKQGDRLYLIFRGTKTIKEWANNLSFNMKEYLLPNHGKVHDGFIQTYKSVRETIMDFLLKNGKKKKLFIAGHSLGGALVTLASPEIEMNMKSKINAIYTFGCPRVGDDAFVKAYNQSFGKRSFRVANTSDIVTTLPLPLPFGILAGGYFSHVDTPVDCTVQENDIDINHHIDTYLAVLQNADHHRGFFH